MDTPPVLSEAQIDLIAEKAAEKAIAKMTSQIYQEIGKGVVTKIFWLVGAFAVGVFAALKSTDWFK